NKNVRTKTVVIDHPYHATWKLLNKEKPIEITDNYLRFEVKAPERQITKLDVVEMRDSWETVMVTSLTPDQILVFARKKYLSEKTKEQLEKIIALKSEITNIDRSLADLRKERGQMFNDQKRLRENLRILGQTTEEKGLRSRYVKLLDQQETQLGELRAKEEDLERLRKAKQSELDKLIETLEQDLRV
ncbi:MAG: hypothetical protein KJ823_04895, partial [Proteobacteria bacterium]|nr:hypothetical protein [Pseudomonadota bacterium]